MNPVKKASVAAIAGLSLAGGSVAVAALSPIGIAGAQDDPAPTEEAETAEDGARFGAHDRGQFFADILDDLVEQGVIDAAQRDAIVDAVDSAADERRAEFEEKRAEWSADREADREALAAAAGVSADELEQRLRDGESLADIAGDNLDAVVDLLVAEATERIDDAVENGRIDQERADEMLAEVETRVTERVNGEGGFRGERRGHHGPRGFDRDFGPGADGTPEDVESAFSDASWEIG